MSANHTESVMGTDESRTKYITLRVKYTVTEVNLTCPLEGLGSHKAWKGHGATRHLQHSALSLIPTVSPAKNSLVYFISIAYIDHPVWRSHREEAKRGPPSGHRIPRIEGAMMSLLLRM